MTAETNNPPVFWNISSDGIATVTIDRPKKYNALNLKVKRLLETAFVSLGADPAVKVIIITGSEGVFVAGTDIAEMMDMASDDHHREESGKIFQILRSCPKPVIAAVEKYALGGGMELALACDIIIAGENTRFAQPEIRVGIMPGAGGTQVLLRTIGKYRTMRMILTGEQISAREAFEWGVVSEVVESSQALAAAEKMATLIAAMPPLAIKAIKTVVMEGLNIGQSEALKLERQAFTSLFDSQDQREGMKAFLEKRKPVYTGT
ncbi:MAG: enoyl-CoA hydratase [Alphaproteobacteria bacterium]|nr:MAG: enoyl-CoA hydratase [Alphaproteobacteria bacterium]